jgi:hypothetical protein
MILTPSALPTQIGTVKTANGTCGPNYKYVSADREVIHPRVLVDLPQTIKTGLFVIDDSVEAEWMVLDEADDIRFVKGKTAEIVVATASAASTNGFSIQFGNSNGAGGVGSSGGAANQFATALYQHPHDCYQKQVRVGKGWVPVDVWNAFRQPVATPVSATAPAQQAITREVLKQELAASREGVHADTKGELERAKAEIAKYVSEGKFKVEMPTSKVTSTNRKCAPANVKTVDGKSVCVTSFPVAKDGSYTGHTTTTGTTTVEGKIQMDVKSTPKK